MRLSPRRGQRPCVNALPGPYRRCLPKQNLSRPRTRLRLRATILARTLLLALPQRTRLKTSPPWWHLRLTSARCPQQLNHRLQSPQYPRRPFPPGNRLCRWNYQAVSQSPTAPPPASPMASRTIAGSAMVTSTSLRAPSRLKVFSSTCSPETSPNKVAARWAQAGWNLRCSASVAATAQLNRRVSACHQASQAHAGRGVASTADAA